MFEPRRPGPDRAPRAAMAAGGGVLRRFGRARRGSTALEFAMLALPFTFLLLVSLELGLIFLLDTTLENATNEIARTVRTGAFQGSGQTETAFKTSICNSMGWMQSNCMANLYLDVRTYSSFSSISLTPPVSNGQFNSGALQFQTGASGTIEVVRAYYPWQLFTPGLDSALAPLSGGKALLIATTAFRNEPYTSS